MAIAPIAILLCPFISLSSAAQETRAKASGSIPAIRGTVREAGSMAPLSGVEVSLSGVEQVSTATGGSFRYNRRIATTKTDVSGAFTFQPEKAGLYTVSASNEGYFPVSQDSLLVELKQGGPSPQLTLVMGRMAFIEGQVLDADTDRPVPHLKVLLRAGSPAWGVRRMVGQSGAATDAEGRFRIGARPYTYFLAIHPQAWDKPRLLATFSEEDRKAVAEDYEETYWPGAADIDAAVPIAMASGGVFSAGVVRVRKTRYHSVRVVVPEGSCAAGEDIQFSIPNNRFGKAGQLLGRARCGKEFLLTGFAPGSYLLEIRPAIGSRPHEEMRRAEVSFEITDGNLDIPVSLERGIDIEGKIVVAEGAAKPTFAGMGIFLEPVVADATVDEKSFRADDQGKLRIVNVRPKEQWFDVTGVPDGYCVREVRYNGTPVRGRLVPFQNGGVSRTLEIVLGDKPAAVTGTVTAGDRPVSRAQVLLVPWPVDSPNAVWPPQQATADGDGKFQFAGLAPGDYLLVALPPDLKDKWREPGVLQPLLSRATKITLQESGFQTVTLGVSGLR